MGSPTINIPGFRDQAGMPLGIQAVARFGQDKTLLCVAAMLEKAFRT
jgi:Asp-tRNA(Asn)/Glu-tRNA(Gln) amidotransferase A subunit family amidase